MDDLLTLPAVCPECDGSLYIDLDDKSDDSDRVICPYCGSSIRIGAAIAEYNENADEPVHTPKQIRRNGGIPKMSLMKLFDSETDTIELDITGGREDLGVSNVFMSDVKMYFTEGLPGIVWFDYSRRKEFEVLDYQWNGPRYQDVVVNDNASTTKTRGGRKGRVAGAIIGTMLMPGIGTVIGAAVGTGRKEVSNTKGQTISHVETQEVPVIATMKLRDLDRDQVVNIAFRCTSSLDARIRNNVTVNLDPGVYIDFGEPEYLPEPEKEPETKDVISQLKELMTLLDQGAITREEYEVLKKKIL